MRPILIILLMASLISNCTTSSNAEKDNPTSTSKTIAIPVENQWWKAFNDPLMDILSEQLLEQNLDIKIAQARLEELRGLSKIETSGFFPNISATSSVSRSNKQIGIIKPTSIAQGGFDTTWEIDVFGSTRAGVKASKQRVNAHIASVEDVVNSVLAECFKTIIEWRQAQEIQKQTIKLLAKQDTQISLFSSQSTAGLIDESALEYAKAQRSQTATQLILSTAAAEATQYKIERLLGKNSGELSNIFTQTNGELSFPAPNNILEVSLDTIRNRPDIRAAHEEMLASQSDLKKAEANLWPRINISGFFGAHDVSGNAPSANNPIWSLAAGITAPILDFGRLRGAVDVANSRAQRASLIYENMVLIALQETRTALSDYLQGTNIVTEQSNSVSHRNQTSKLAFERYNNGLTDMVNLMVAQSEFDAATIILIERKAETAISWIRLNKALGITFQSIKTNEQRSK
jgi:outer membrane protein, multidrug efflux system